MLDLCSTHQSCPVVIPNILISSGKWRTDWIIISFLSILIVQAAAQTTLQFTEPNSGTIHLTDSISIPAEDAGYTLILPDKKALGLIVMFNSDRDTLNKIWKHAVPMDIAVMYVTTGNPLDFLFQDSGLALLDQYIGHAISEHDLPKDKLLFAGMSLAGTRAIKMAQYCAAGLSDYGLMPRCIAICDAPLDFVRFWQTCTRAGEIAFHPASENEGKWVSKHLEKNLGGSPEKTYRQRYINYSPYYRGKEGQEKIKLLARVAVRAYHEPDIDWWMTKRGKDYYDMNSIDAAALINDLRLTGNREAELVTTTDLGYLPDGRRHPHSWSIVDEKELVEWFGKMIGLQ